MKTDRYTKIILTVIAFCMVINLLEKIDIIPSAYANETAPSVPATTNAAPAYGLVPLNKDGSINVSLKNATPMDVNIVGIKTYDDLDVNVNLKSIGGSSTYGEIPVKIKQ